MHFNRVYKKARKRFLAEQENAPLSSGSALNASPGAETPMPPSPGGLGGGQPEQPQQQDPTQGIDDNTKRNLEPYKVTEEALNGMIENATPKMFQNYLKMYGSGMAENDENQLVLQYQDIYQKIEKMMEETGFEEPDMAKGGDGRAGASGVGVK
jgi:hypothetical protein